MLTFQHFSCLLSLPLHFIYHLSFISFDVHYLKLFFLVILSGIIGDKAIPDLKFPQQSILKSQFIKRQSLKDFKKL
jgi:hypothetical protein